MQRAIWCGLGALVVTTFVVSRTADAQSRSNQGNCDWGPEEHVWPYADDSNKTVTTTGVLKADKHGDFIHGAQDGDVHMNLAKDANNVWLQQDPDKTAKARNHLGTEINLRAGKNEAATPLANLMLQKFNSKLNVRVKGDWVVDHHRWGVGIDKEDPYTELHPIRWIKGSKEDPDTSSNIVFFLGQDLAHCRDFKSTDHDISTTLTVPLPVVADEADLSAPTAARSKDVGVLVEQSVLDATATQARSLYAPTQVGFPEVPAVRLALTLHPPHPPSMLLPQSTPFPAYLAEFAASTAAVFNDVLTYQVVTVPGGTKAIYVKVSAKLSGSSSARTLTTATWASTKNGSLVAFTEMPNPTNRAFELEGFYKPSESPGGLLWTVAVKGTDRALQELPSAAEQGFSETRRYLNKTRTYRLTPSFVSLAASRDPQGPSMMCSTKVDLRATDHVLPQVALVGKLKWKVRRPLLTAFQYGSVSVAVPETLARTAELPLPAATAATPASVAAALPYELTVDPGNDHLASLTFKDIGAQTVVVEVSGETELGEKMSAEVEVRPVCGAPPDIEVVDPRWWFIWKGGLALQRASFGLPGGPQVGQLPIDDDSGILDPAAWGTKLDTASRKEQATFIKFVSGAGLDKTDVDTLKKVAARGQKIKLRREPTKKEIEAMMEAHRIVDRGSISNGAPIPDRRR